MPIDDDFTSEVQKLWEKHHGGMALGWFLVGEGVAPDGSRRLDYFWPTDTMTWNVRGYLSEALADQDAGQTAGQTAELLMDVEDVEDE